MLHGPFLPRAVAVGEIYLDIVHAPSAQPCGDVEMCREFAPVVCRDGLQAFPVCEELPDDRFRNRPRLPAVRQLLHHHEVCQALHKDKDGVAVAVHYEVHLKVAETLAVCLGRVVVYARTAGYVGGLDRFPAWRRPALKVGMAAVQAQLAARVRVDDVVDALQLVNLGETSVSFFCIANLLPWIPGKQGRSWGALRPRRLASPAVFFIVF